VRWVVGRLLLVSSITGCTTTSTIYRVSGPPVEADIVGGSRSALLLEDDDGRKSILPRGDVHEIDYPGNVHAVVGGIVLGYGVLNVATAMEDCQEGRGDTELEQRSFCVGVFTPAAVGLGMLIWGVLVNTAAKKA